jgi:hypothetical protein
MDINSLLQFASFEIEFVLSSSFMCPELSIDELLNVHTQLNHMFPIARLQLTCESTALPNVVPFHRLDSRPRPPLPEIDGAYPTGVNSGVSMKRREFVEKLGIGSALVVSSSALSAPGHAAPTQEQEDDHGNHQPIRGELSNATVSFGAWPVGTVAVPIDRVAIPIAPFQLNVHQLIPYVATIKQGGSVNFSVAGFHHIVVYAPGTKPEDIAAAVAADPTLLEPIPNAPPTVGIINFPTNRIYRGLDPRGAVLPSPPSPPPPASPITIPTPQDRVEVVQFSEPGRYLVICAVNVHFNEGMFGYIRVRRNDDD